jgi:hypothetical protein
VMQTVKPLPPESEVPVPAAAPVSCEGAPTNVGDYAADSAWITSAGTTQEATDRAACLKGWSVPAEDVPGMASALHITPGATGGAS